MKTKRVVMFFASVCFVMIISPYGCGGGGGGGDTDGDNNNGSNTTLELEVVLGQPGPGDEEDYFPLAVGNFWHFNGTITGISYENTINVTGTTSIGDNTAMILRDENAYGEGPPVETYLVEDPNGIADLGSDDPLSDDMAPYWEVRFPLTTGESFVQLDRSGIDFGEDLDDDGVNETADIESVVTVQGFETVSVPAGTFSNALKIRREMTIDLTLSDDSSGATATVVETVWLGAGVGWLKRVGTMTLLGVSETATEELDAYMVEGDAIGITEVIGNMIDDVIGPDETETYAFTVTPGVSVTASLTGLTGDADLTVYSADSLVSYHTGRGESLPEDYIVIPSGNQLFLSVNGNETADFTLFVTPSPTVATPANEGDWATPLEITPGMPTAGQVATRGESFYAASGLTPGMHSISITGLSADADLHVFSDDTYSMEVDATLNAPGDITNEPEACMVDTNGNVYFSVRSGELNLDGASYVLLVH